MPYNAFAPVLQQINRQGDILMYADQARRRDMMMAEEMRRNAFAEEQQRRAIAEQTALKNAFSQMPDIESMEPAQLFQIGRTVAGKDLQLGIGLMTKASELEAARRKAQEMTPAQEELAAHRKMMFAETQANRAQAQADRTAQQAAMDEDRRERRRLEQERINELKRRNQRDEQGLAPRKDYRWNEYGEQEVVPGTKEDAKFRAEYAADTTNVERIEESLERTKNTIDSILKNDNGLKWVTGYTGYAPDFVSRDKKDVQLKLDELKNQVFVQAIEALKGSGNGSTGLGQLTEVEGNKIQNSFANLEKAQSYEQMVNALKTINAVVTSTGQRVRKKYEMEWSGREPKPLGQKQTWKKENLELRTADDFLKNKFGGD